MRRVAPLRARNCKVSSPLRPVTAPSAATDREIRLPPVHRRRRCAERLPRARAARDRGAAARPRAARSSTRTPRRRTCSSCRRSRSSAVRPREIFIDSANLLDADRQGGARSGASYTEQELELGGAGQAAAASHLHRLADRGARRDAAARVPPHRPAAQDRARGAAAGAAAGEPRADPQSRARDQESAGRHPRRGAAARARARPAAADRIHAGHHRRGRPAAVARQPAADAAPRCRRTGAPTSTRSWCACKGVVQAEFPQVAFVSDFDTSLPEFDADPEQLTQAVLNIVRNAAQAVVGTTAGPEIRLTTRVARGVTLAKQAPSPRARAVDRRQRSGRSRGSARPDLLSAGLRAARAAAGWGSRSRRRSSRSTTARSNARACRADTVFTILLPLEIGRAGA